MKAEHILNGAVCPYCHNDTELVDSKIIYGRSYGMVYICKPCYAWVGVHKGTNKSLGRLANAELRSWKKEAHRHFDPLWKDKIIHKIWKARIPDTSTRSKAYEWLACQMGMKTDYCHIGMMNEAQCKIVVEICKRAMKELA